MNQNFNTLSEAINGLRKEGYTEDFNLLENCIECRALGFKIFVEDFVIDKTYRFEGDSNPDDSSVLYAVSSDKFKIKGVLVDAYGVYADSITPDMIEKLRYRNDKHS